MRQSRHEASGWASIEMLSIFCVDDDTDILTIVRLALELDGDVHAHVASSADEALRVLLSTDYRPDCILLDVAMPNVDGRMLLGEIREIPHHRDTPVIFLTAHVMEKEHREYLALGALGMIAKPFNPLVLAAQVRSLLSQNDGRASLYPEPGI